MHTFFFSFENFGILKKKKRRGFLQVRSRPSVPWKFRAPDYEGLAEVTDRAAAEPGRLGFIATDLSVRLDLQASA